MPHKENAKSCSWCIRVTRALLSLQKIPTGCLKGSSWIVGYNFWKFSYRISSSSGVEPGAMLIFFKRMLIITAPRNIIMISKLNTSLVKQFCGHSSIIDINQALTLPPFCPPIKITLTWGAIWCSRRSSSLAISTFPTTSWGFNPYTWNKSK